MVLQKQMDKRATAGKMLRRMMYIKLGQAWRAWRARVGASKEKHAKLFRAVACFTKMQARKAFSSWVDYVAWQAEKRDIVARYARANFQVVLLVRILGQQPYELSALKSEHEKILAMQSGTCSCDLACCSCL